MSVRAVPFNESWRRCALLLCLFGSSHASAQAFKEFLPDSATAGQTLAAAASFDVPPIGVVPVGFTPAGITIRSVGTIQGSNLNMVLDISPSAPLGAYTFSYRIGANILSVPNAFAVVMVTLSRTTAQQGERFSATATFIPRAPRDTISQVGFTPGIGIAVSNLTPLASGVAFTMDISPVAPPGPYTFSYGLRNSAGVIQVANAFTVLPLNVVVSPAIGKPGQSTAAIATFGNAGAAGQVVRLSFSPPGLSVRDVRPSSNSAQVPFTIDVSATAPAGSFSMLVTFASGGQLTVPNAFTVIPSERVVGPRIEWIRPSQLRPGERYRLEVWGKNFTPGMQVIFGQGVEIIGAPAVLSPTQSSIEVMVAPSAPPGARSATVSSFAGSNSGPGGLEIVPIGWKPSDLPRDPRERLHVPDRVLAVISLGAPAAMRAVADDLARIHRLAVVEVDALQATGDGLIVFTILDGAPVLTKAAALQGDSRVRLAQPDFIFATSAGEPQLTPSLSYGPVLIKSDRLRGYVSGNGVTVAIVDTGVDVEHPALQGKVIERVDMTGKGFSADVHGTMMAGIVGARGANGRPMEGVAPGAHLLSIKACHPDTPQSTESQCWSLSLAKGTDLAISRGARVINLSVAGPQDRLLGRVLEAAVSKGSFVACAAGNDGPTGSPAFPAALGRVTAVTAIDASERIYPRATQGLYVDISAPGVEVISTAPGGKYLVSSGTSQAAAHVAGAAALILEREPRITPGALQNLMESTAKDLGEAGKDPVFGSGLLDLCGCAAKLGWSPPSCRPSISVNKPR